MRQYEQPGWSSRVLGFCSRVFAPAGGDGKPRGGRRGERQPAEDRINTRLCRVNTTSSVCSCALRRSPVCAPAINWRARSSPALQLLCAARRSVAPRLARLGRRGHLRLKALCHDSFPWGCRRVPALGERACVHLQMAGRVLLQPP